MTQSELEKFVGLLEGLDVFLSFSPTQSLFMCSLGERSERKLGVEASGDSWEGTKGK